MSRFWLFIRPDTFTKAADGIRLAMEAGVEKLQLKLLSPHEPPLEVQFIARTPEPVDRSSETYTLTLTRAQLAGLDSSLRIANAASRAFRRGEWQPRRYADTTLLRRLIAVVEQSGAALPLNELDSWLRKT